MDKYQEKLIKSVEPTFKDCKCCQYFSIADGKPQCHIEHNHIDECMKLDVENI